MAATIKLSQLPTVQNLDNSDLLLITDFESSTSRKVTVGDFKNNIFSGDTIDAFANVDLTTTPPEDGQFLRYDGSDNKWKAGDISLSSLGELSDVDLITDLPDAGQTLIWDGTKFVPGTIDLSPLFSLIGEGFGDVDMGIFVNSPYLEDNSNIRQHLQALSNGIVSETSARTDAVNQLQALIDALDVDIAPETLNSINELAAAMGDDPNFLTTLQGQVTSLSASTASVDAGLQGQITTLQNTINDLDIDIAPETLNSINELAAALNDDPNFLTTVNNNVSTNATDISNIETILYKLVPEPPTTMAGLALTVTTNDVARRLCSGFTDRTGGTSGLVAGDSVKRNTDGSITTNKLDDIGPGDSGEIQVKISQNSYDVTTSMASGTQVLDFMGLKITDNKDANLSTRDAGIPAGFYQVYDIQLVDAHLQHNTNGLHYVQFTHAGNSTQKAYFYEDESNPGFPLLITSSVYLPTSPSYNYSSGVPHYSNSTDNDFTYNLIARYLSGDMYIDHTIATSSQTAGFTHQGNKTYTDFGGSNPPAKDFGGDGQKTTTVTQYPRDLHTQVSNNQFSNWSITTPYGSTSNRPSTNMTFNIMGNTARTNVVDEDNILVSNLGSGAGNAYRVGDSTGNNPVSNQQDWDPLATPDAHEAIVVGGVLKHDRTDYSTGYRPEGPDLSSRNVDPQYAEFEIKRSGVSQFTINYTGSCSGCWVTMPNNTSWQTSLSGTNGWADMFQAYKGSGVPTSAEPGCSSGGLMDNNGGSFTCVFGTESSSNDSENSILVRWKLAEGQSITSMSFSA